jgi:hypothetical protein
MLEGVVGIVEGMNPKLIRNKLEAYQRQTGKPPVDDRARPEGVGAPARG